MIVVVVGCHLFAFLLVWMLQSGIAAAAFLSLVGLIELIFWKRRPIIDWIVDSVEQSRARRRELERVNELARKEMIADEPAARRGCPGLAQYPGRERLFNPSPPDSQLEVNIGPRSSSDRVRMPELIPPRPTSSSSAADPKRKDPPPVPTRSESVPTPKPSRNWHGMLGRFPTLSTAGAILPDDRVGFVGPGKTIHLDRGRITSALVYGTATPQYGSYDASLIDGSLTVAPAGPSSVESLPYWPTYHDASPSQRSRYLDWLVGGRSDPRIELGYVFIYFYGLERRILVDNSDHEAIAREVLRLRGIYSHSRSFQRYSSALLWMIVALAAKGSLLSRELLDQILADTAQWGEDSLGRCLSYLYDSGSKLSADWAYLVAKQDRRVQNSVIVRRHEAIFRELFTKKFVGRFPEGMDLKASRRSSNFAYRPASSTLLQSLGSEAEARIGELPNVLSIQSQFKPLVAIWDDCVEELRTYDRAHRATGKLSAQAYEALPPELQTGDHPDYDKWFALWRESADAEGVPIVSIHRLAALKGISERRTLLKTQCNDILRTATCLGIGIEPDARLMGRNYRWDDVVTLLLIDGPDDANAVTYQAASSLLQLGMIVAAADGRIDVEEVRRITEHLEDQFELTANESRRLEAHRLLLQNTKPDPGKLLTALKKRLTQEQRSLVGEYLIGVAAADQVITAEERRCLQRIFAALDLSKTKLDQLIQPVVTARPVGPNKVGTDGAEEDSFYLDHQAISRIMRDTEAVAAILKNAMAEMDEEEADPETPSRRWESPPVAVATATEVERVAMATPAPLKPGAGDLTPPARFRAFFEAIILRSEWSEDEAKGLARQHQVMLGGAVEALNEWSQERWNDWLIEEGDPLRVRLDLLERKPL